MKDFKDMWEDSAANSVGAGGVDMPADVQQDKKRKKPVYDGRTKAGRKFVEKMLARRNAKKAAQDLTAQKTNAASVQMKEDTVDEAKKPVSKMTPAEKEADAKKRKEYKAYQKSKRNEAADPKVAKAIQGLNDLGNKMKGRDQKDVRRIEKLYRSGNNKLFQGAIRALDTDLRDQVKDIFDALGMVDKGVIG
jgi:hypothetical protein